MNKEIEEEEGAENVKPVQIVGFVRELTTEELEEMGRRGEKKIRKSEKGGAILSPLLIHPIDNKLVQMR